MTSSGAAYGKVVFSVECATNLGDSLFLVGGHACIGDWEPSKAVRCSTSEDKYPHWEVEVILPVGVAVEYKYFSCAPGSSEQLQWEDLPVNRWVKLTSSSPYFTAVNDGCFGGVRSSLTVRALAPSEPLENLGSPAGRPIDESPLGSQDRQTPLSNTPVWIIDWLLPVTVVSLNDEKIEFAWDQTNLRGKLDCIQSLTDVYWVGWLGQQVPSHLQAEVCAELKKIKCFPVFLDDDLASASFGLYVGRVLRPTFAHIINAHEQTVEQDELWQAYVDTNRHFSAVASGLVSPGDVALVMGYELIIAASMLKRSVPSLRTAFWFLSPFPSSEVFRTVARRNDLLRSLLTCDLVGFELFDYSRHFLHCCTRLLRAQVLSTKGGHLGIRFDGRYVLVRAAHAGCDISALKQELSLSDTLQFKASWMQRFRGRVLLVGHDTLDRLSGILLKLTAWEDFLRESESWRSRAVLVQIVVPPLRKSLAATGAHLDDVDLLTELTQLTRRIQDSFPGCLHVEHRKLSQREKLGLFAASDVLVNTSVRQGLDSSPLEFILASEAKKGQVIISEFAGFSRVLSGALRVNPWDTPSVVNALDQVLSKDKIQRAEVYRKLLRVSRGPDLLAWATSVLQDALIGVSVRGNVDCLTSSSTPQTLRLDAPPQSHISKKRVVELFQRASSRLIVLDWNRVGNIATCRKVAAALQNLSQSERNSVWALSSGTTGSLNDFFEGASGIGLAAEHGCYLKPPWASAWHTVSRATSCPWMPAVKQVMKDYNQRINGSVIWEGSGTLAWDFRACDAELGLIQSREMRRRLVHDFSTRNINVSQGPHFLEVRPQGVSKAAVIAAAVNELRRKQSNPRLIIVVGDEQADEDIFAMLAPDLLDKHTAAITITVGARPTLATGFVHDDDEVAELLDSLVLGHFKSKRSHSVADLGKLSVAK